MTNISIPIHLFVKFKDLHGEELAREYFEVYDNTVQSINEEVGKEVLAKKLELKSELLGELVTKHEFKAEIKEVRAEIKEVRAEIKEVRSELNEFKSEVRAEFRVIKFTSYILISLVLIFIGTSNPTFVEIVKALLR